MLYLKTYLLAIYISSPSTILEDDTLFIECTNKMFNKFNRLFDGDGDYVVEAQQAQQEQTNNTWMDFIC